MRGGTAPEKHLLDPGAVMGKAEFVVAGELRNLETVGSNETVLHQHLGEAAELAHREAVTLGHVRLVGRVVDDRQHRAGNLDRRE